MSDTNLLIGLVVLAWMIYRQVQVRAVKDSTRRVVLALAAVGVYSTAQAVKGHHLSGAAIGLLASSFAVAAGFGLLRASTVRIWARDGVIVRQGTWLTSLLWLASVAAHLGIDAWIDAVGGPRGIGSASLLLYLAVTWWFQGVVIQMRATPLRVGGPTAGTGGVVGR